MPACASHPATKRRAPLALLFCLASTLAVAQSIVHIDASAPVPAPQPVTARLGANRNPSGHIIAANSQYLTMDGKPWLPVMGEFHFSRYPEAEWEEEILKMKAAGVTIVSTYVIWIHHEQNEGVFDWTSQRDLRKFVELCGKHGMYVYPRIGPWAHAETRNGGLPDWVMKNSPVRLNDPVYLKEVGAFYAQIAQQLNGLLWKDGGPVIGIQIENEYHETGPGGGSEHIRTLKKMAVDDGLDVPLYTVTGWDGAAIPLDAALPVFGGYPDAPWDGSPKKMPPSEVYAFRFMNRVAGNMGAIGAPGQNAASTYRGTPFLTAEVGGGIEDTYFRRPVVTADDIAAMAPVMLGSGANLLGYYMFHGGRNPDGGAITLQESQRTGYPTDVPEKSYDFQAPLGEFGQQRESLRKLKLIHYFLADFGALLAPMTPRTPAELPANPSDITVPRTSARTSGDKGFIFFNNYVRGVTMPARTGFQVELQLPSGTVRVPETPLNLPSGAYGIWPVNFDLGGTILRYSTAQLFKRVVVSGRTFYFFFTIPGIRPEFLLGPNARIVAHPQNVEVLATKAGTRLTMQPDIETRVDLATGQTIVLLPEQSAEKIWSGDDPNLLISTATAAFANGHTWTLESTADPRFDFEIFGAARPLATGNTLRAGNRCSLFAGYTATLPAVTLTAKVTAARTAGPRTPWQFGPKFSWRPEPVPLAPDDKDFEGAATWNIVVPPAGPNVSDTFLRIRYQGDAARLYQNTHLIDDNFWNGLPWEVGMREIDSASKSESQNFQLRILPLPKSFPMYLEKATDLHFIDGAAGTLNSVELVPQYQLIFELPPTR